MQFQLKFQFQLWQFQFNSNYGNSNSNYGNSNSNYGDSNSNDDNSNSNFGIGNTFQFRSGIDPGSETSVLGDATRGEERGGEGQEQGI